MYIVIDLDLYIVRNRLRSCYIGGIFMFAVT